MGSHFRCTCGAAYADLDELLACRGRGHRPADPPATRRERPARRGWSADEDALIMAHKGVATDAEIAAAIGRTAAAIHARRYQLRRGAGRRCRPWRAEEDERLRAWVGREPAAAIARELGRSEAAVKSRAGELGLSWKRPAGEALLTAHEVGRLLGRGCSKAVAGWAAAGYLAATRGATPRERGGRPVWRVAPAALRAFLRDYPWLYDRARIADPPLAAFVATLPPARSVGVGEAARRLGYTESGINKLIRRGYLAAEKRGANWRIPEEALAGFARPARGSAARGRGCPPQRVTARAATLAARRTSGYRAKPETVARQEAGRANRRAARLIADPVGLAARVGLAGEECAYWLPRLPAGLPAARIVAKLGEIATLLRENREGAGDWRLAHAGRRAALAGAGEAAD